LRISISAETNDGLNSIVAHHFGRSPFFVFIDLENRKAKKVEVVNNPCFDRHQPGQVTGFINENKVDVMLSGGMGGRAIQFFQQLGIQTATDACGTAQLVLKSYLDGSLIGTAPCKESIALGHG
jgi:predicted Fe-Mo cluster-binding NifX family protein